MDKSKNKKHSRKAPEDLLLQRPFEFDVPRSLEECSDRINNLSTGLFSPYKSIYLSSIDQKRIEFHICRSAGKSGEVWAVGYLQAKGDFLTHVVGKTGIPAFDVACIAMIFVLVGVIVGIQEGVGFLLCGFPFVMILIILVMWAGIEYTRASILRKFRY